MDQPTSRLGRKGKLVRAANDNRSRQVCVNLQPPAMLSIAEVEVFGAFLAELEAANDNHLFGEAS